MHILERDFDVDEVLKKPLMASLSTMGERGACESPVWFLWEDELLWFIASAGSGFVKRLKLDPRSSVGVVDFDLRAGLLRHVGMRGRTEVLPMEPDRRARLLEHYLGPEPTWNSWFKTNVIDKQDVLLRFTPQSIVARDQSYFR